MKCFRHEPGKICPDCGLDRTMKTPREIIQRVTQNTMMTELIIAGLEVHGYTFMQAISRPHAIVVDYTVTTAGNVVKM